MPKNNFKLTKDKILDRMHQLSKKSREPKVLPATPPEFDQNDWLGLRYNEDRTYQVIMNRAQSLLSDDMDFIEEHEQRPARPNVPTDRTYQWYRGPGIIDGIVNRVIPIAQNEPIEINVTVDEMPSFEQRPYVTIGEVGFEEETVLENFHAAMRRHARSSDRRLFGHSDDDEDATVPDLSGMSF
jgi:hypothetical protein